MGFSEANRLRCAGTAYLWLGAVAAAQRQLEDALDMYVREDPGRVYAFVAITRADLVCARLENGDVDGATAALDPVFELTDERNVSPV